MSTNGASKSLYKTSLYFLTYCFTDREVKTVFHSLGFEYRSLRTPVEILMENNGLNFIVSSKQK